jgi:hypothetical protein
VFPLIGAALPASEQPKGQARHKISQTFPTLVPGVVDLRRGVGAGPPSVPPQHTFPLDSARAATLKEFEAGRNLLKEDHHGC